MAWRLVNGLDTLRSQVRKAAPRAVPPATPATAWGTIADSLHDSASDHAAKVYAALGSTPVVCAADFPHAPALGLDGGAFTEALRQSRDPRIGYVIFNGRIFSGHAVGSVPAYVWRIYTGSDKHREHWHVSTVHTAAADDTSPWRMPPGTPTGAAGMTNPVNPIAFDDLIFTVSDISTLSETITGGPDRGKPNALATAIKGIQSQVNSNGSGISAALSAVSTLRAILDGIAQQLATGTPPADARTLSDADVARVAKAVLDEEHRRSAE